MTDTNYPAIEVRMLEPDQLTIVAQIDRSEEIAVGYAVGASRLIKRDGHWSVPAWDPVGDGEHSVAHIQEWLRPIVGRGATLMGAFDGDQVAGMAVVQSDFEPELAWLAALYVNRAYRRHGVASALWARCAQIATAAGAGSIYVSSAPTGSAVGFYLRQGCELASEPNPELFAFEPEDIHLTCPLPR